MVILQKKFHRLSYNDFILLKFEIFAKARTLEYIAK